MAIAFPSCEIANNYTEQGDYQFQYRRPVGLVMSHFLDSLSLTGKGVKIGVIDAGFGDFYSNDFTKNLNVQEYKDFVDNDITDFFEDTEHDHGTVVTSSIGGKKDNYVHGLAFNAEFFLAKTEDVSSELPDEEKRLIDAVDWLISKNVDVINISIAYTKFDDVDYYTRKDLDGKTALSSKHIDSVLQANPELIITVSAGNKGNKEWSNIMVPGDVREVITVGSTDFDGEIRWKSSGLGLESVNYIKPDVATYPIPTGNSHTAPVIAGLCALLKEQYPDLTRQELIKALHKTSSNANAPNREIGYGVPNSEKLIMELK
jgi:subtilisin family serine protease